MTLSSVCVVYTQDAELVRRAKAYLRTTALVRHVKEASRLEATVAQNAPAVVLLDLRAKETRALVEQLQREQPEALLIALGTPRSDPLRDAEQFGIYAAEDLQLERNRFQALLARAFDYLALAEQNRELREDTRSISPSPATEIVSSMSRASGLPLMRFPRVFRRFDNVEALLANVVEGVADAVGVTRVGIFSRIRAGDRYKLRAGLRCLPDTGEVDYDERDPLVRWFEKNAHLISRDNLPQITQLSERSLLRRALDTFGAEVIVPLYARGRIIGWLFFGRRLTGQRFEYGDLENLMLLAENVSTVLENALLYEEVTIQKTLAETLLKSIPPGIVAIDEEGMIRWFNPPAEEILGVAAADALNQPAEAAGSKLALLLRETLDTTSPLPPEQWLEPNTRRPLSAEARRLMDGQKPLGAVAVIQDLTVEDNLRQKQDLLERAAFWTDLAASMSHEIRNPLVAIKTFAQLLPERFDDADFRASFSEIVVKEVERLDKIITQINSFAHPAQLNLRLLDVRGPVEQGLEMARRKFSVNGGVAIETKLPADLPQILGDGDALAEVVAHLVANAAEAVVDKRKPKITLSAKPIRENGHASGVLVTVQDNGRGIAPEMRDKVFSPFCTTKARGMGLGLPIVKRTVFDHNGRVDIDTNPHGTVVSIALPATARAE
ncbi:MAG: ATP-binding protein [Verrucomicrobiota bacterium]|nr:ATP-binding protein [Verrucomicrobiota bacterium]